jgi:hypothetical protein
VQYVGLDILDLREQVVVMFLAAPIIYRDTSIVKTKVFFILARLLWFRLLRNVFFLVLFLFEFLFAGSLEPLKNLLDWDVDLISDLESMIDCTINNTGDDF